MAEAKRARIRSVEELSADTRLLELEAAEPLGFVGGQYVIVNSKITLPGGKVAKRAYSILSSDAEQTRFQLAVKKIDAGPGSHFLHDLRPGSEMEFSGPWGKFHAAESPPDGSVWLWVTDTGITAALGLLRSKAFAAALPQTSFCWWVPSEDYFLPMPFVKKILPRTLGAFRIEHLSPAGSSDRPAPPLDRLAWEKRQAVPRHAFLAGDGAVIFPLRDALVASGLPHESIRLECYFNNPQKKSV
jgi:ferredoxin-NADP reductase